MKKLIFLLVVLSLIATPIESILIYNLLLKYNFAGQIGEASIWYAFLKGIVLFGYIIQNLIIRP